LTSRANWRWSDTGTSPLQVMKTLQDRSHWASIARSFYRSTDTTFIELGCAPGDSSALLTFRTNLEAYGVDFSEDSDVYLSTMQRMGKEATPYREDVSHFSPQRRYDIVASCGLIEHFRGSSLTDLLHKHDDLLNPGGLLIIEIPNMTGFQYF